MYKQVKRSTGKTESIHSTSREFSLVLSQTHAYRKNRHGTKRESSEQKNTPERQVSNLSEGSAGKWRRQTAGLTTVYTEKASSDRLYLVIREYWCSCYQYFGAPNSALTVKINCILTELMNNSLSKM